MRDIKYTSENYYDFLDANDDLREDDLDYRIEEITEFLIQAVLEILEKTDLSLTEIIDESITS